MSIINPMKLSNVLNMAQLVNGRDKNSNLSVSDSRAHILATTAGHN